MALSAFERQNNIADKVSIAVMRDKAMMQLMSAMASISEIVEVELAEVPMHNRDASYLQAAQLQALAGWADCVAQRLNDPSVALVDSAELADLRKALDETKKALDEANAALSARAQQPETAETAVPTEEVKQQGESDGAQTQKAASRRNG